ncbi:MAG TPA: hypothetical protein VFG04_08950 [Planctomycetaceae bacterium]|jgi:hypothetical protein|nr:hypothetical protein [Planctomycetaceae bacterium]
MAIKSDFQAVRKAIKQRWNVKPEAWEQAADDAVSVILDPQTTGRQKLSAFLVLIDAAAIGPFNVEASLKRILGGRGQGDAAENDQASAGGS